MARRLTLALALVTAALVLAGPAVAATPDFGPNVKIFDPSMSTSDIRTAVDAIATQQIPDQFGTNRYALLFKPGTYGTAADPLNFRIGYYTEFTGVGATPDDVHINGTIDSYNQCFGPNDCTALVNFWRGMSNLTIDVAGKGGCQFGQFWAVSQAAPMRRVHVNGFMTLMDYCTPPSFASGGFISDSLFTGSTIVNGSQQQWLVRNSNIDGWTNGVWNQVFSGVQNAPPQSFPNPPYTTLPTTPASREKPFLTVDSAGRWSVFVPSPQTDSSGPTWTAAQTPGESIPINRFLIVKPGDSEWSINLALALGKNLIFTPGVYDIDTPIVVTRPDTVILGLGMATLTAQNGVVPMTVLNAKGVDISGLIFDAGPKNSPALLVFGLGGGSKKDPGALQDVFFRIGGPHVGKATTSLVVGANNAILDDIWAWRADHGNGVGWTVNTADTGVVVTGDDVVATGLFAEHYQKHEVFWSGEDGKVIMFQNEMPYDPPNQAAYRHDGVLGWASIKVADRVKTWEGWGLGSYCFFNVDPTIHAAHAYEVPVRPGVKLHDILTLSITNHGTIDNVVNDAGGPTISDDSGDSSHQPNTVPTNVVSYP